MTQPSDDPNKVDPKTLEETRERLARADTAHGTTQTTGGTGSGSSGPVERSPAQSIGRTEGAASSPPPATGSSGVSSGLHPGGAKPRTGAGGHGDVQGNMRTSGPGGRPKR
ncbi:MAG TPA: hypothetical protein VD995_29180 [Azospirillum sp.]|nr:hypothetical protein [Azospirillum sp.]